MKKNDSALLQVFLHDQLIGTLLNLPGDKNLFSFSQEYIDDPLRNTLSLSFLDETSHLLTNIKTVRTRLPPFFSNLLPEGAMRDYLASHAKVSPEREFYLLAALGSDLPGAIKVSAPQSLNIEPPPQKRPSRSFIDDGAMHFSLAGVQLKFSGIRKNDGGITIPIDGVGGSWIIKLPFPSYSGVPQNEYAMMDLARKIGIDVPETALVPIENIHGLPKEMANLGTHAFIIKRFDRDEKGQAIHIEDLAQVFEVYPEKKYQAANYQNIASIVYALFENEGLIEFIRRFVFNALIGNGDMHLKNWSLIYPDKRLPKLAPAYDFVSTLPYIPNDTLALNFLKSKAFETLTIDQFKRFAAKSMIPEELVLETLKVTVERFNEIWGKLNPAILDEKIYKTISEHLKKLPFYSEI